MNKSHYLKLKNAALKSLLPEMAKEYHCHVQFVVKIGIYLSKKLGADVKTVEIAALFHDIGRGKEKIDESHPEAGSRITQDIIDRLIPNLPEKQIILSCIKNHSGKISVTTLEEKIIITADSASKVIYFPAFMLMCKKESFIERAAWGLEYLDKGMKNILIASLRKEIQPIYREYKETYRRVLDS